MLRNYFNLKILVNELQILVGSIFSDCFTQEKNVLHFFTFDGDIERVLQFCADPILGSLFLRSKFFRSKSNSANVFPQIVGQQILSVELIPYQRVVKIETKNNFIFFQLFGGKQNNCFLCDKDLRIVDTFKNSNKFLGEQFIIERQQKREIENRTLSEFFEKDRFLGKWYGMILFSRLSVAPNSFINTIDECQLSEILCYEEDLIKQIEQSKEFLLYRWGEEFVVSAVHFNVVELFAKFKTINDAMFNCYIQAVKYRHLIQRKKELISTIQKELLRINSRIQRQEYIQVIENLANQYLNWGSILLSQSNLKEKGFTQLEAKDLDGQNIIIPLKPELTILQNAESYFEKSRKLRTQVEKQKEVSSLLVPRRDELEEILESIKGINDNLRLEELAMKHREKFQEFDSEQNSGKESKFRRFDLGDGFVLYVGKNAKSNDELTFSFARPNDYWLHTRGVSGSHCVLRCPNKESPPKEIFQRAAQITAYYSKAKNSKYVPVAYTQRKYIKKPKGAEPGTVVLMREEVLFVEPKLPMMEK